jgi:hypothetical protein
MNADSTQMNADNDLPGLESNISEDSPGLSPATLPGLKPDMSNNLPRWRPDISPGYQPDTSGNHPGNSSGEYLDNNHRENPR